MRHHDLKCWPSAFAAVASGQKRHEVRVNDRDYMPGDTVTLREWDPTTTNHVTRGYTTRALDFVIGHVTEAGTWGLPSQPRICVFTLLPPTTSKETK